jgi:iron complex outermembrane recepter protein
LETSPRGVYGFLIVPGQRFIWPLLLALGIASGQTPQASNPDTSSGLAKYKTMSLEELTQIDVTILSREPERAFQTPAAIYIITGADIRRSGATSIPEALRLAPGVEVERIDANKWAIGIRGFGTRLTRSVLVLIDGRTVFTPLFDGTYWEVQDTFMDDIDRIEVIRGPGATIWGPNAVNGVINVITKSSKETRGMLATAGGGNEEQGFAGFRYGGGNGNDFSYRFYGKGFTRGPEVHSDGQNFDDWRAAQGGFRMDWNKGGRALTLQGDFYMERAGESVQANTYTAPYTQVLDANARLSGGNIMGHWEKTLRGGSDIQIQAYYDRTNRYEPNLGERRDTFDIDFLHRIRLPARQQVSWGVGVQFSHANDLEVVTGLTFVPSRRTDDLLSGFVQDEISLVEKRLSLVVGTKLLHTNFTSVEAEPSARILWTPSDSQTIWTAFTHAVRTPSDVEEDFFLAGYTGQTVGGLPLLARFNANPGFAPEQLNGYELGYRKLLGRNAGVGVAGFYNHYHDLLSEDFAGPVFLETDPAPIHYLLPAQFRNGLLGNTKGVEVTPEWRPATFWRLRGSYSYLHMSLWKAPGSGDVGTAPGIVGSSPQHVAWVQSSFDVRKTIQLDVDWRYASALPGELVPAYSTADARFAWRFKEQFELAVAGRNLLQPSHFEAAGDPGPLVGIKRSAYLQLTWSK